MTRREMLVEQYEDALFALLMDEVAEAEGQKALEENQRLRESGELVIPDNLRQRCHSAIARKSAEIGLKQFSRGLTKIVTKVAVVALVGMLLFTTAFAASEDFRLKALNIVMEVFDDHIEIKSDSDIGVANSGGENTPQISAGWLPEGFVLVDEGQSAIMSWQSYAIDGTVAQISINSWNLQSGRVSFDTETAEILPIQIHGQTAFLIEDADTLQIAWNLYGDNGWLYYVAGQGVTTDELIKVAETTKIC